MMFAPIYDNGSCLNPLLEDEEISKLNDTELRNIIYNVYSCFKINNKKIHYSLLKVGKMIIVMKLY